MPLEALACRTPVVATRVGGCVETIRPGKNGYLVDIEDAEGLADRASEILLLDEARWTEFSQSAANVAAEFSWEQCTELLESVLKDIVRDGRDRATLAA